MKVVTERNVNINIDFKRLNSTRKISEELQENLVIAEESQEITSMMIKLPSQIDIQRRTLSAIMNSLKEGEVPRIGLGYIAVGREKK